MSVPAVRVLPSSRPAPRTWLRPVPQPATPVGREPRAAPAARPTRAGRLEQVGRAWGARVPEELPDATRWAGWLALALGEALLGRRPATQLSGWVSREVLAGLHRRQRLRPADDQAPRTVLVSGRVQHPGPCAVEACAVLRSGPRTLVLAFRLEGHAGQWVCTALEAGLAPGPAGRSRPRATGATSAG